MSIKVIKTRLDFEKVWLPLPKELVLSERNPNYIQSLVVGIVSPIWNLPYILAANIIWPFIKSIFVTVSYLALSIFGGLIGRAQGRRISKIETLPLTDKEIEAELDNMLRDTGYIAVKVDTVQKLKLLQEAKENVIRH